MKTVNVRPHLLALALVLGFLTACATAPPAEAAGVVQGYVERGNTSFLTNLLGERQKGIRVYPGAQVTVYNTGTATLATIYSDLVSTPKANPFYADSSGWFKFYTNELQVDLTFSGAGFTSFSQTYVTGVVYGGAFITQAEGDARYAELATANTFTAANTFTLATASPILIKPASAPSANTVLFDVQATGAGVTNFSVDAEGDTVANSAQVNATSNAWVSLNSGVGGGKPTLKFNRGTGVAGTTVAEFNFVDAATDELQLNTGVADGTSGTPLVVYAGNGNVSLGNSTMTITGAVGGVGTTTFNSAVSLGGSATATTPASTDNDTSVATTAFTRSGYMYLSSTSNNGAAVGITFPGITLPTYFTVQNDNATTDNAGSHLVVSSTNPNEADLLVAFNQGAPGVGNELYTLGRFEDNDRFSLREGALPGTKIFEVDPGPPPYVRFITGFAFGTSGPRITNHISATASLNYGAVAANSCSDLTITLTGAADGNVVSLGVPTALASTAGLQFSAFVSLADTVTVRACNVTTSASADPAAATVRVSITQY